MSFTKVQEYIGGGMRETEYDYVASGTTQAFDIGAQRIIGVTINEVGDGGTGGTEIARISGVYAIASGCSNTKSYKVFIKWI